MLWKQRLWKKILTKFLIGKEIHLLIQLHIKYMFYLFRAIQSYYSQNRKNRNSTLRKINLKKTLDKFADLSKLNITRDRIDSLNDKLLKSVQTFTLSTELIPNKRLYFLVASAPHHFLARRFIRTTWGQTKLQNKFRFQIVFLLGKTPYRYKYMSHIYAESQKYHDIAMAGMYLFVIFMHF